MLLCLIEVNVPTAYIVLPHCTSWRTCSTTPVAFSCGVFAGVGDTEALAADAVPARHRAAAPAITPARRPSHHWRRCICDPLLRSSPCAPYQARLSMAGQTRYSSD